MYLKSCQQHLGIWQWKMQFYRCHRAVCKTNICHWQIPNWHLQLFKYNKATPILMHYKTLFSFEPWKGSKHWINKMQWNIVDLNMTTLSVQNVNIWGFFGYLYSPDLNKYLIKAGLWGRCCFYWIILKSLDMLHLKELIDIYNISTVDSKL